MSRVLPFRSKAEKGGERTPATRPEAVVPPLTCREHHLLRTLSAVIDTLVLLKEAELTGVRRAVCRGGFND